MLYEWELNDYFAQEQNKIDGLFSCRLFKSYENRFIEFIAKKIIKKSGRFKLSNVLLFFLGDWKYSILDYDLVIIVDTTKFNYIYKYIKTYNPQIEIILWFWNPVAKSRLEGIIKGNKDIKAYTFDKFDSRKYSIKHKNQYYFSSIVLPARNIDNDIFFIGADKGRKKELLQLEKIFKFYGLRCNINIVGKKYKFPINIYHKALEFFGIIHDKYKDGMDYDTALEQISRSNAILDFVQVGQTGMSMRPLEALFFNKKLVTNNLEIIKEDFYNKNNIFIIGKDKIEEIKDFLERPYIEISASIKDRYDFKNWIKEFQDTNKNINLKRYIE